LFKGVEFYLILNIGKDKWGGFWDDKVIWIIMMCLGVELNAKDYFYFYMHVLNV
jgi:hypothetical protein